MNEALWSWFWALSAPLNPHDRPSSGSSTPWTSNRLSVPVPASSLTVAAPNQYSRTSPTPLPDPPSGRHRSVMAGSDVHWAFSNGS